jgi:hypothetical protein
MSFLRPKRYFSENKARKTFRHIEIPVARRFAGVPGYVADGSFAAELFASGPP